MNWNACAVPPLGYHEGRVHAPDCITHGPFSAPAVCAVARTMVVPAVPATPSIVCAPERVTFEVVTRPEDGLTEPLHIVSVMAPVATEVALPDEVTGPVRLAFVVTVAALPVVDPDVPLALPVRLPVNAPVVVPGSVTPPAGKLSVHEPDDVIGEEPVTVIWFAVPSSPTLVTVPDPPPLDEPLLQFHADPARYANAPDPAPVHGAVAAQSVHQRQLPSSGALSWLKVTRGGAPAAAVMPVAAIAIALA